MKEIEFESLRRKDEPDLSIEGTRRTIENERRHTKISILTDHPFFYTRNWLAGNKIPYDKIVERMKILTEDSPPKPQELSVKEKRMKSLEKARAAKKKKAGVS